MNYLDKYNLNEEISEFTLLINDNYSEHYANACDIKNYSSKFVNPTELATLSLKHFLKKFPIPEGSIHTAQEVEIFKSIGYKGVNLFKAYNHYNRVLRVKI